MDEKVRKKRSKIDRSKDNMDMQMNDEKDMGRSSIEVEPNRKKEKKQKDKKNKHGTDKVFNWNEVAEENCTGIEAKRKTCSNEGGVTYMRNGEEENNKSKRKKRKRVRDNNEIVNSNTADDKEMQLLDDKQERKMRKRNNCDDSISGIQETAALKSSNKSKGTEDMEFKSREGGSSLARVKTRDAYTHSVTTEVDDQGKKMKKKKLSNKSKRTEGSEFKSNGGDPAIAESNEGDPPLVNINMGDASAHSLATEVDDQGKKMKKNKKKKLNNNCKRTEGNEFKSNDIQGKNQKKKKKKKKSNEDKHATKRKFCNAVADADNSSDLAHEGTPKRVTFSDRVEVFNDGLVRGKRFTPEEDEKIKKAVHNYIDTRGLGDEGLDMILHCKSHHEVRNCWKEIAEALPHRPCVSIYYRAHILFERDEKRKWTPEEYEFLRKFQEKHGSDWKSLADAMGKHRFHVKDAWRRIKLTNTNKGRWQQEEYQNLFDLVNNDLRLRALEDYRKLKHGMLRDNVCWEAIGDKLATRTSQHCCKKWYDQLTSPMVVEGIWADTDDYRLLNALFALDACCMEEVDWDNVLEHRSGDVCRKRWKQMVQHIGEHGTMSFAEKVEVLSKRYCPDLVEAREAFDSKPVIP